MAKGKKTANLLRNITQSYKTIVAEVKKHSIANLLTDRSSSTTVQVQTGATNPTPSTPSDEGINTFKNVKTGNESVVTKVTKSSLVYSFLFLCAFFIIIALLVFFAAFKGPEEVLVPNVVGMNLADALIALQERGMQSNIQLRYFSDPLLKNKVAIQNPDPGSIAKVGKTISLVVSRGTVIETVKNYVGTTLPEVRTELQALNASYSSPLLVIGDVSYVYSNKPTGTILEQEPLQATPLVEQTNLNLVISQGKAPLTNIIANYIGMDYTDAMVALAEKGIAFTVALATAEDNIASEEQVVIEENTDATLAGKIAAHFPEEGTFLLPSSIVKLFMLPPQIPEGSIFEMVDFQLPENDLLANISVVSRNSDGEETVLFTGKYTGGMFTFPYLGPRGITLILYRYETEMDRHIILD